MDPWLDENDILRDQGEAYASKLRDADVPTACVRFNGTMHDFINLAALRDTETTRAALSLAGSTFRRAFGTDRITISARYWATWSEAQRPSAAGLPGSMDVVEARVRIGG